MPPLPNNDKASEQQSAVDDVSLIYSRPCWSYPTFAYVDPSAYRNNLLEDDVNVNVNVHNSPYCTRAWAASNYTNGNLRNMRGMLIFTYFSEEPIKRVFLGSDLTGWNDLLQMDPVVGRDGKKFFESVVPVHSFGPVRSAHVNYKYYVEGPDGSFIWHADPKSHGYLYSEFQNSRCFPVQTLEDSYVDIKSVPENILTKFTDCYITFRMTNLSGIARGIYDISPAAVAKSMSKNPNGCSDGLMYGEKIDNVYDSRVSDRLRFFHKADIDNGNIDKVDYRPELGMTAKIGC